MRQNDPSELESNEFEMVLGNTQLLSVFFIVVVLLGVFFTMGYVLGRNSSPVEAARGTESFERQNAPSAMPVSSSSEPAGSVAEQAASDAGAAESDGASGTRAAEGSTATRVIDPEPGETYLQVMAVAKSEAEVLTEVLVRKGFRAFVSPGPNDKLFRVLVGPTKDIDEVARLKAELEAATGARPFVKKF